MKQKIPGWFVFHVPHDSTCIPDDVRHQFALSDSELADEVLKMTDHHTLELFTDGILARQIVRAEVSRLVVDVERFAEDNEEDMAKVGMGAVYKQTQSRSPLRHLLSVSDRNNLLNKWYYPHHEALTTNVDAALNEYGKCLVIDCHSFPSKPLPYEQAQSVDRPQFCIGTDRFHTPKQISKHLIDVLRQDGFTVKENSPFEGALVPQKFYQQDKRVNAVMIEVRRDLYMNEDAGEKSSRFTDTALIVRRLLANSHDFGGDI